MPNASLTAALKEAYRSAPTNKYFIHTLEFRQVGVQNSVRFARSHFEVTATDEDSNSVVFSPSQFDFSLPSVTDDGLLSISFRVSNIENELGAFMVAAQGDTTTIEVIYRPYISDDLTAPSMSPPLTLFLKSVEISQLAVSGTATFADVVNAKYPRMLYTRENFPGIG